MDSGEVMIELISVDDSEKWNKIVKSYENWDIYYLNGYQKMILKHEEAFCFLVNYNKGGFSLCFPIIVKDLSNYEPFINYPFNHQTFDANTPYGYGGPIYRGAWNREIIKDFLDNLNALFSEHNIISLFIRFHPLLQNQIPFYSEMNVNDVKKTIFIDTSNLENILSNMHSKARNTLKKAISSNLRIFVSKELKDEFIDIYHQTMDQNNAKEYYYFDRCYFETMINELRDNLIFFYAEYEEKIIAASIFLYNSQYMHYHLSGLLKDYRNLGSTNLILYEAAKWAFYSGIKVLHLGGGLTNEDGLHKFKHRMNLNGEVQFAIGSILSNVNLCDDLVNYRIINDPNFDKGNDLLIRYRGDKK